ncbi:DEAD/DEAH box helicase family protein [Adlercreutzia agrestimuris]|uniref:DEAD/DEAH box helicase family protein n=1 Tax=Adlercreutzia agrestimuris TaxID=2941324 RepID=UPI0020426926|nr:DEAD/DEAH box helicase family protein [Adlercreutzia agrestimuris]
MVAPHIKPMGQIVPMIYAYTTPEIERHNGWTKIGYTEAQTVEERIKQQTHTADVKWELGWKRNAQYQDGSGEYFTDKAFHGFLTGKKGVEQEADKNNEWFHIAPPPALEYFNEFASRDYNADVAGEHLDYTLREEQDDAVVDTLSYFKDGGKEFLWNAKPRFGKTLSTYDLVRRMGEKQDLPMKVMVVTNRPSIANSWAEDFYKFFGWRGNLCFVSENDAVKGKPGVLSRDEYLKLLNEKPRGEKPGMVAFESLQGLKGSMYFGGVFDKLKWISEIEFDLLVVDESQEGVDTEKTDRAFRNIKRKHTLYLSGTPFKALADGRFNQDQIYNWSYVDEQRAKRHFDGEGFNVYEALPELQMFTYQISPMLEGELRKGAAITDDGSTIDYAFDLNEFFSVNDPAASSPTFRYKADIEKFLDALTTNEKYPFSTPDLRDELPHTIWLLDRVASAKALAKMLKEHPVFSEYEIVLAAGDGRLDEEEAAEKAFDKVRRAISNNPKTITLSVGQLTVGVTVPAWTGILMLSNMKSPSSYMQAAFRVQNPYETTSIIDGKPQRVRKERAYVFDFDPARTLIIFDEFANNLRSGTAGGSGTAEDRKENIRELLNFFPVLGEDEDGKMVEIDAQAVLSIPRRLKSVEVVRRGFMSNYLFSNIGNIFAAPAAVTKIVKNIKPAKKDDFNAQVNTMANLGGLTDDQGEISIPDEIVVGRTADLFGSKTYEVIEATVVPAMDELIDNDDVATIKQNVKAVAEALKGAVEKDVIDKAFGSYDLRKSKRNQLVKETTSTIDYFFTRVNGDFDQQMRIAEAERKRKVKEAETTQEIEAAEVDYKKALEDATGALKESVDKFQRETIENKPKEVTKKLETFKAEEEKAGVEDMVRDHLRGFSRTIPSFIMAYGDENLTLANFDDYTEDDVFVEVTGITEEQFRFLRDGGEYVDEETGETEYFAGHLFDETVFNDSIREFLAKRDELADYFDETHTEDIFDYIPPQKTNQIYTPRWVVKKMVEELEKENPGCYDDANATFADLYMKSGLYITEVVKRLFNSDGLKMAYPDERERIRHILSKQVYGMAPTRIIYLIAMNYIFGFDPELREKARSDKLPNFVEADAAAAAKEGTLQQLVDQVFSGC